eukprot:scaffold1692_cov313-Pinguiococcus_pyrenoidosus.AAC.1
MAHVDGNHDGRLVTQDSNSRLARVHRKHNAPGLQRFRPFSGERMEGRGDMGTLLVQEFRGHKREYEDVAQVGKATVGTQEIFCPNSAVVCPTEVEVFRAGDACVSNLDRTTADRDLVAELCHRRIHKRYFGQGGAAFRA